MAVAGLPEPRKDHAVVMVRFASECLQKVVELAHRLETVLGPDTADLTVRVGIHSGPVSHLLPQRFICVARKMLFSPSMCAPISYVVQVTAGVLRGA